MTRRTTYVVACLTGHGVGPEVMAGASRALAAVSRQHGFTVEQVHPPFAGEAMTQTGHPLPAATRSATLGADAILAAGATEPALEDVKAELDLAARMVRIVLDDGRDLTLVAPLHESSEDWTLERAFLTARARSGSIASVAISAEWRDRVARHAARHAGVAFADLSLADALHGLARDTTVAGMLLVERSLSDAIVGAPQLGGRRYLSATGFLSASGPGLFTPHHEHSAEAAGQGVANPSEALLAAALLLGEGLGRRSAAEALDESLGAALSARRTDARPRRGRRLRDDAGVRRRGARPPAERAPRHRVRAGGGTMKMNGADADPALARGRGRRGDVRHPGRGDHADVRRHGPRHHRASRARASRAGRGPHGPGLRASVRPGRRRDRDLGPRRDEPRHSDRRRVDGLHAPRLHHGPGAHDADRHGRLPGVRHHRHHDAGRQALVARPGRARHPARDEGGLPHRAHRAVRPRARRRPARRAGGRAGLRLAGVGRPAGLASAVEGAPAAGSRGGADDRPRREARPLRRRRHAQRRRVRRAARSGGGREAAGDHDADGQGRVPRDARAALRLAGHARPEVVEPRHEHVRRARGDRLTLRRSRHRQADGVRPGRDRRAPRRRPRGDLQAARRGRAGGGPPEEGARRPAATASSATAPTALPRPRRGCGRSRSGATSSRSGTARARSGSSRRS